jgi:hypothetical protein
MKAKHKFGEVFNHCGNILVITSVTLTSYKPGEHLYRFNYLSKSSANPLNSWPFYLNYDDSDLAKFKRIKL